MMNQAGSHSTRSAATWSVLAQEQAGDAAAEQVTELFQQYYDPVAAYIFCLVDDWEVAHDLAQETFLQLFQTRARLAAVENPRAWVYRIATHLALNKLKRARRFAWLPWSAVDGKPQFEWRDPAEETRQRDLIERALAALAPRYRAPLLLYAHYGLHIKEIAEALALTEGAVKVQLHRAREQFRQALAKEMDDD
jgi:RNA polymerase sigma-70 factor, ECF subfamily